MFLELPVYSLPARGNAPTVMAGALCVREARGLIPMPFKIPIPGDSHSPLVSPYVSRSLVLRDILGLKLAGFVPGLAGAQDAQFGAADDFPIDAP